MKHVTDATFKEEIIDKKGVILVDFWAEWCGPCRQIAPSLEELSKEWGDKVSIVKVNVDENPDSPGKYGVRGIPTLILFKDGEINSTKVGALPKSKIQEWVNAIL
jgi:thioredoxin 1